MIKQFFLQSRFFMYELPTHTNIMTAKAFNFFDECTAICVHLFLQEEEYTSSS